MVAVTGTLGLGIPMYESLGDILIFGLGRGEGIGTELPKKPGVGLGDKFTCSNARACNSAGYSFTHPILGPTPLLHLHSKRFGTSINGASILLPGFSCRSSVLTNLTGISKSTSSTTMSSDDVAVDVSLTMSLSE